MESKNPSIASLRTSGSEILTRALDQDFAICCHWCNIVVLEISISILLGVAACQQ